MSDPPKKSTGKRVSILKQPTRRGAGGGGRSVYNARASTVSGVQTVNFCVIPAGSTNAHSGDEVDIGGGDSGGRRLSFAPKRLLDIECGNHILVTSQKFLGDDRFQEIDSEGALVVTAKSTAPIAQEDTTFFAERSDSLKDKIRRGDVSAFDANDEVGVLGGAWRGALRRVMVLGHDETNALRLSRALQFFLAFQSGHESYLISEVIEALDSGRKRDVKFVLKVAFKNRNVSRNILQTIGPRWDFLWHTDTMVRRNRLFDAWGQIPIVGITGFAGSENFVGTRNFAVGSILRVALGRGNWLTRVSTGNREGLLTDDPNNVAQNLAAESNSFELSNRSQFGTHNGRLKTNDFRLVHRLPTDESIVRTFVASPTSTMLNNGVEHTLRQLAKHWHNMLYQHGGNFAHQRMEQLDPFETLRFHMPAVLTTLSTLRGRTAWDGRVLGPFISQLQSLKPSFTADGARQLCRTLKESIIIEVCGGIASRVDPFSSWVDAISQACDGVEKEAQEVYELISPVEIGIRLGYDVTTQSSWRVPSDAALKRAIIAHIRGESTGEVNEQRIRTAMTLITPRDKRTFIELVQKNLTKSKPAQLLLGRAMTLLQRDLRRELMNEKIQELSRGVHVDKCEKDEWYILEESSGRADVYRYDAKVTGEDRHRFVHVDSGLEKFVSLSDGTVRVRTYIPIAESITRAQRAYMYLELDHGKKFSYNAFMEFSYLRQALKRMAVVGQIACEELDKARLNILKEVQRSNQAQISVYDLEPGKTYYTYDSVKKSYEPFVCEKKYTPDDPEWERLAPTRIVRVPPQSMIVIGGGPTGLMTSVHCTENVLISGGNLKLYEARDAFTKAGSTFERAQIVRLDPRWIAMLRYHLGTLYEDVYIPAAGETDSQLGNTLPTQGFVEITIKDLENMLHVEVSKMNSKGLIQHSTGSGAVYDIEANGLTKLGANLKEEDLILRRVNAEGRPAEGYTSWKVVGLDYTKPLTPDELEINQEYGVYIRTENRVRTYRLIGIDLSTNDYTFKPEGSSSLNLKVSSLDLTKGAKEAGGDNIKASGTSFPTVYPKGTTKHGEVNKITVECVERGSHGGHIREELPFAQIQKGKFNIDTGHTHVVEAIGKPHGSKVHFCSTTHEPYGVCCIQGLKISMGMHNFGEKRWGSGIIDDIRSQSDQNTRVVGDFTKMVRSPPVVKLMYEFMTDRKDDNWPRHWNKLVEESNYSELNVLDPVVPKIQRACKELWDQSPDFRRQTLQTRFFETGDNYYLGMEFNREYDLWKENLGTELVAPLTLKARDDDERKKIGRFRGILVHHIDRLWYDACLEVIRTGDVYNPGAQARVPRIYLINHVTETALGKLPVGDSFRLVDNSEEKYEVVIKTASQIVVRNVEGYISKMSKSTRVRLESNLTRNPDGNNESRVSIATFPVAHYVNFRTIRLNDTEKGYVFAFMGDEQSTPHFMRYSGLTGACINAMLFNNFIKQAIDGVPFQDRFRLYSKETNWSNGEVVTRGTGANYGEDGFLRPGFSYDHGLDYLHSKVIEYREADRDLDNILSRDWKIKFASALVPRGMEMNEGYIKVLNQQLISNIMDKFIKEVGKDKKIGSDELVGMLRARAKEMEQDRMLSSNESYWTEYMSGLDANEETKKLLSDEHVYNAKLLEQVGVQIIEFAKKQYLYNERISSELFNQPKAVDTVYDDFAPEAQNFANSLAMSASFSSAFVAFNLLGSRAGNIAAGVLGGLNLIISFGTMANSARYQIRNEEARVEFFDQKMTSVKKGVFGVIDPNSRGSVDPRDNPFVAAVEHHKDVFVKNVKYYDYPVPTEFMAEYERLANNAGDPNAVRHFMEQIVNRFISDTYHVNSYLQEYLVNLYKACEELLMSLEAGSKAGNSEAASLYQRIVDFEPRLEGDLERTAVRGGFVRRRPFSHWTAVVAVKYIFSLFCCARVNGPTACAPLAIETLGIVKQASKVDSRQQDAHMSRAYRDLSSLYWATKESQVGSLIFGAGFLVFIASLLFTIARIFSIDILLEVASWASVASAVGAILACFHFLRKLRYLFGVYFAIGKQARDRGASTDVRESIKVVKKVTRAQIYLTLMRFLFTLGAAVALPWAAAQGQFGENFVTPPRTPFWIALGSVGLAGLSVLYFFFVEYGVRYSLTPKLGEFVCESFREELEEMYERFSVPPNDIDTKQVQERETWEYVAREFLHKYRFDTVFAVDRFGSILQYIQSGLNPRDNEKNQVVTLVSGV